jgi:hypothetical protein
VALLAQPEPGERDDPDPALQAQRNHFRLCAASDVLNEPVVRALLLPAIGLTLDLGPERGQIDVLGIGPNPVGDLPDTANEIDGLVREEAEQDLRCTAALSHLGPLRDCPQPEVFTIIRLVRTSGPY